MTSNVTDRPRDERLWTKAASQVYTVFLFSNDPKDDKPLWTKDFRADDADDADERAVKLVRPQLRKFPTAEDWAVYPKGSKRAKTDPAEELAIRFLLAEDMVEQDGKAKLAAAPKPPHGGQRAEKLVDKTDKHVLWRTGGVQGQMTKMWVITDYTGRYLEVGGRPSGYRKKREAMDAWSEVKAGNFKMTRSAKTNAKVVEVPNTFHAVNLEPPKKVRKEYPFEGYIDFQGIKIDVENVKGGTRSGTGPEGDWSTFMHAHYGEIRGTEGTDGDMLDVYVGDNHDSSIVVVIHQHNPWDGAYDEDKVVIGCESVEEAIGLYKKQYDRPGFFLKDEYTAMPIGAFWRWVKDTRNKGKRVKVGSGEGVLDLSTSKTLDYKFIDKATPGTKVMLAPNRGVSGQDWRYYVYEKQQDGAWNAVLVYVGRPTYGAGAPFIAKPLRPRKTSPKSGTGPGSSQYDSSTWYEDLKYGMVRSYSPSMFKKGLPRTAAMWKKGYVEMKPGALNDARDRTFTVLALLRALAWSHQASHWQISGDSSYGDHQLFDRIYGPIVGETDALAEKLVGTFGSSVVDAAWQVGVVSKFVTAMSEIACPFQRGLHGERVFQVVLKNAVEYLEGLGQLSLGLDDFLRTMANSHDTAIYLLQQRQGGVKMASATASPRQAARRRARAFTARCIILAMEFTEEGWKKHKQEHPGADARDHQIGKSKPSGGGSKEKSPKDEGKSKGKWDPKKVDEYKEEYDPTYDYKGEIAKAKKETAYHEGQRDKELTTLKAKIRGNKDIAKAIGDAKDSDLTFEFKAGQGGYGATLRMSIKGKPYMSRLNISSDDANGFNSSAKDIARSKAYHDDMAGEWAWGQANGGGDKKATLVESMTRYGSEVVADLMP
jgi:hypothetical protein